MRIKESNFIVGIFFLIVSQILIKCFGLIYSLYLTNKNGFGDEGNAIYMSGYQIYALLLTFSSIGVPNAISKLISEKNSIRDYYNKERILKIAIIIFGTVGGLGSIILFCSAGFISEKILGISKAKNSLIALSPAILFVSINSVFRGYCNGESKIKITAKSQLFEQIVKSILTILFVEIFSHITSNIETLSAVANLATSVATFCSMIYIISKIKQMTRNVIIPSFPRERIRQIGIRILKTSLPITIFSILTVFGKNIDSITIVRLLRNKIGEKEAISKYGILSSKVDILVSLPLSFNSAISTALVPEISSKIAKNDVQGLARRIELSIATTLLMCVPYCFGIFFYSDAIFNILFPNASMGAELLKLSAVSLIFSAISQTISSSLHGMGKNQVPLIASIIGIIIKLLFNILLIPINNIYEKGAVFSNTISNISFFLIVYIFLNKYIKLDLKIRHFLNPIICSSLMLFFSNFLKRFLEKIFIDIRMINIFEILFCVIIYLIFLILFKKMIKNKIVENIENTETHKI